MKLTTKLFSFDRGKKPQHAATKAVTKVPPEMWVKIVQHCKQEHPSKAQRIALHVARALPSSARALKPLLDLEELHDAQKRVRVHIGGIPQSKWLVLTAIHHPDLPLRAIARVRQAHTLQLNAIRPRSALTFMEESPTYEMDLRTWKVRVKNVAMSTRQRFNFSTTLGQLAESLTVLDLSHTAVSLFYGPVLGGLQPHSITSFSIFGPRFLDAEKIKADFRQLKNLKLFYLRGETTHASFVRALPLSELNLDVFDISGSSFHAFLSIHEDAHIKRLDANNLKVLPGQSPNLLQAAVGDWQWPRRTEVLSIRNQEHSAFIVTFTMQMEAKKPRRLATQA